MDVVLKVSRKGRGGVGFRKVRLSRRLTGNAVGTMAALKSPAIVRCAIAARAEIALQRPDESMCSRPISPKNSTGFCPYSGVIKT